MSPQASLKSPMIDGYDNNSQQKVNKLEKKLIIQK